MKSAVGLLLLAAYLAACSDATNSVEPNGWDMDEIAARAMSSEGQGSSDIRKFELRSPEPFALAWSRRVDDRPLEVDQCYIVVRGKDSANREAWLLASMYSHGTGEPWRVSWVSHSEQRGRILFGAPPTRAELEAFILDWDIRDDSFRSQGAGLCEPNWSLVCGTPPSDGFRSAWATRY
jgi:hypothetical protein